jgi:hypothetical protein
MTDLDAQQWHALWHLRVRVDRARRQFDRTIFDVNRYVADRVGAIGKPGERRCLSSAELEILLHVKEDNAYFLLVAADQVRKARDYAVTSGMGAPTMITADEVRALRNLTEHWDDWQRPGDVTVNDKPWLDTSMAGKRWQAARGEDRPLEGWVFGGHGVVTNIHGLRVPEFRCDLDALDNFLAVHEM